MNVSLTQSAPNLSEVALGDITVFFSYETPVAFSAPGVGLVVSTNVWTTTTGRHLSVIDGGSADAKKRRIPHADFQTALAAALNMLDVKAGA